MNLTFPFRNITTNSLWGFRENTFLDHYFVEYKQSENENYKDIVKMNIQSYLDFLPNFENEILQIINTSNQPTIKHYFTSLKEDCEWLLNIDREEVRKEIEERNKEKYESFLEKVEKKSKEYFSKEERTKYAHLEEYETYAFSFMSLGLDTSKKVKRTNYNFYCIEEKAELIDLNFLDEYIELLTKLTLEFEKIANKYTEKFDNGEIVAKEENFYEKSVVYVEGQHDIDLITKAAELLDKMEVLGQIELRQRGEYRNLDKIWKFYKEHSVEISGQIKILLYDCDTKKLDEDFGYVFKRTMPTFSGHIISKGIENLFNNVTTQKALKHKKEFIDFCTIRKTTRGIESYEEINEVNKDEKANFCKWICETGTKDDFANFIVIFEMIEKIITNANNGYK